MGRPAERPSIRVLNALRRRLDSGEWESGAQLPTVREVADAYGVSTRTVHNAYRVLADEGLIVITPGWGTHRA
jgi:DNA-binding GntR family transcriptional regulator